MKLYQHGDGKRKIGIVGCLHGDELIGRDVFELLLQKSISEVDLKLVIANEEAMSQGVRYVETDLNRSFPGSLHGSKEEILAYRLREELSDREFVIDLHSTTADTEDFIIATNTDEQVRRLIAAVPMQKAVFMPAQLAQGAALINHITGVSLEFSRLRTPQYVASLVLRTIENLTNGICLVKDEYFGTVVLRGNTVLKNFKIVPSGTIIEGQIMTEDFYPVLSGEKAYAGVCCIMCKKISRNINNENEFKE